MELQELRRAWNEIARTDPFWAALTEAEKQAGKWKLPDFFETGVKEISALIQYIDELGVKIPRRRALDFGCGPGRLTQALATYFDQVDGLDISSSMIELARRLNRQGGKCAYHVNEKDDLRIFPDKTFELVYSNLTLQHMEPQYAKRYIREFVRVLTPNGLAVFQLPSRRTDILGRLKTIVPSNVLELYRRIRYPGRLALSLYGVRREDVVELCVGAGAQIIDITINHDAGTRWESFRYCCRRTT